KDRSILDDPGIAIDLRLGSFALGSYHKHPRQAGAIRVKSRLTGPRTFSFALYHAAHVGCSPPPCGEGSVGGGRPPIPAPPPPAPALRAAPTPKGEGRTECAARADSTSREYALHCARHRSNWRFLGGGQRAGGGQGGPEQDRDPRIPDAGCPRRRRFDENGGRRHLRNR